MRRGPRSVRQQLAGVIGGFEIIVVFLGVLVAFGLEELTPTQAFIGGALIILGLITAIVFMRSLVGVLLGWLVHLGIIATGLIVPMMFLVGAMFTAAWAYAMYQGTRIDHSASSATTLE